VERSPEKILVQLALELKAQPSQIRTAVALLDGGASVAFSARHSNKSTEGLDDVQLRELEERRAAASKSIVEQGNLTPALQGVIEAGPGNRNSKTCMCRSR
jgi:protein Tex